MSPICNIGEVVLFRSMDGDSNVIVFDFTCLGVLVNFSASLKFIHGMVAESLLAYLTGFRMYC